MRHFLHLKYYTLPGKGGMKVFDKFKKTFDKNTITLEHDKKGTITRFITDLNYHVMKYEILEKTVEGWYFKSSYDYTTDTDESDNEEIDRLNLLAENE